MEQRLIKLNEIEVGDEIIISCFSRLKYLKVIKIPIKKDSTTFRCSIKKIQHNKGTYNWTKNIFEQDVTQHNEVIYQDLCSRDIFLIKR